jgi:hypothetical protein
MHYPLAPMRTSSPAGVTAEVSLRWRTATADDSLCQEIHLRGASYHVDAAPVHSGRMYGVDVSISPSDPAMHVWSCAYAAQVWKTTFVEGGRVVKRRRDDPKNRGLTMFFGGYNKWVSVLAAWDSELVQWTHKGRWSPARGLVRESTAY